MTQVIHPGIPGTNYWYTNRGRARMAAIRYATQMGPGYRIVWNKSHARGQLPHYHLVDPFGVQVRGIHFFYGPRPPIKAPPGGRPVREFDGERSDTELDQFFDEVWGRFKSAFTPAVTIIPRSGWGARAPKCSQALALPVRFAFIHHTAGSAPTTESSEKATMRGIQNFHQNDRGWCDIAYSFVIMPSGRIYEGRGWTRVNGATKGYNSNSIAICWAGNYENIAPTAASIAAGQALLAQGVREGYLTPDFQLFGHRDKGTTACPGRHLYARLADLRPR